MHTLHEGCRHLFTSQSDTGQEGRACIYSYTLIALKMNSQKLFQNLYIKDIADELCIDIYIVKCIQICIYVPGSSRV